ncbi:MAG: hypothetical protein RL326_532 [Pseudomonadota bacterium]|jgi:hypothetical protein
MKAKEYVEKIIAELTSARRKNATAMRGAFLGAALQIIRDVESPLKEEALVTLATLELRTRRRDSLPRPKIA